MSLVLFKNVINKMFTNPMYSIYKYKEDLALNNLQRLICHQTKSSYKLGFQIMIFKAISLMEDRYNKISISLPPPLVLCWIIKEFTKYPHHLENKTNNCRITDKVNIENYKILCLKVFFFSCIGRCLCWTNLISACEESTSLPDELYDLYLWAATFI